MRKEQKTEINILIEMIPITKTTLSKSIGSLNTIYMVGHLYMVQYLKSTGMFILYV